MAAQTPPALPVTGSKAAPAPRLLDQVRAAIPVHHYSLRTEQAYVPWIVRFIHCHNKHHPRDGHRGDKRLPEGQAFREVLARLADDLTGVGTFVSAAALAILGAMFLWRLDGTDRVASGKA